MICELTITKTKMNTITKWCFNMTATTNNVLQVTKILFECCTMHLLAQIILY